MDGAPGMEPADHILEVEVGLDELAAILGEELELPRIQPRGRRSVPVEKVKYSNVRRVGPESLPHFKRTFREALKRQIASGVYDAGAPLIAPIREDRWHKGKFGKEYDECDDVESRRRWDRKLGLGRQKIFEVRKIYSDVMFIDA